MSPKGKLLADDIRCFRNRVRFKGADGSPAWETVAVIWHGPQRNQGAEK